MLKVNYRSIQLLLHSTLNYLMTNLLLPKFPTGLGRWSVHMFMIFHLHRQDVMAPGDLGIRNGLTSFLGLPKKSLEGTGVKHHDRIMELTRSWRYFKNY